MDRTRSLIAFAACGLVALAGVSALAAEPPKLPAGYKLVFEQPVDDAAALDAFAFSDPAAWQFYEGEGRTALEQFQPSKYAPKHRSPLNIALVDGRQFDDFILDVELQQTSKEYGHRDMCLYFGFQDPNHFYYAHIATKTDAHAHNLFIVNDAPRAKISTTTTAGHDWGDAVWHHVRLARTSADGAISLYVNDLEKPIMTAVDKSFARGWLGFGTFDDTGRIDNIRVWGKELAVKKIEFFPKRKANE